MRRLFVIGFIALISCAASAQVATAKYACTQPKTNGLCGQWIAIIPPAPLTLKIGTVTTLPAGSQATASISGVAPNWVVNLGIPVGATGAQGTQGVPGQQGQTGATGPQGPPWVPPPFLTITPNATGTAGTVKLMGTFTVCDPTASSCPQWTCIPKAQSATTATLACTAVVQ